MERAAEQIVLRDQTQVEQPWARTATKRAKTANAGMNMRGFLSFTLEERLIEVE